MVTGLTPTAAGAVSINATAVVNGQTIAATITQTNFATAAEAAAAASSAGGASGSGGGASGGGSGGAAGGGGGGIGGMSGATLGIVGGGIAAAGALVATQAGGDSPAASTGTSGNTGTGTATTPTTPAPTTPSNGGTFNGPFSGSFISTGSSNTTGEPTISCTSTYAVTGTMRVVLNNTTDGSAAGTGSADAMFRETATTCTVPGLDLSPDGQPVPFSFTGPVTGTSGSLRFTQDTTSNQNVQGAQINSRFTSTFAGIDSAATR